MKKILFLFLIISIYSCDNYKYKSDKGKICAELLAERSTIRFNGDLRLIPAVDKLFLQCGCDSLQ